MSSNLLQTVQESLCVAPLQKVDANTQEVIVTENKPDEDRFNQAVIPSVLIALYKYSRADEGAEAILHGQATDWADFIFGDHKKEAIAEIAAYSDRNSGEAIDKINAVTTVAIQVIREKVTGKGTIIDVKQILSDSRDEVLLYLPASMQIGKLLHDNTLDDRTHKMEGPVSSLMHAIGGSFSGSDSDEH